MTDGSQSSSAQAESRRFGWPALLGVGVAALVIGMVLGRNSLAPKTAFQSGESKVAEATRTDDFAAPTPAPPAAEEKVGMSVGERADAIEKAAKQGDFGAVIASAGGLSAEEANAPLADHDALKALAPKTLGAMSRRSIGVETLKRPFKATVLTADYAGEGKTMRLKVTNTAMVSALMGVAGMLGAEYDRETADGFERLRRVGEGMAMEQWSSAARTGKFARSVGGRFLVEVEGEGVALADLEAGLALLSEERLGGLPETD